MSARSRKSKRTANRPSPKAATANQHPWSTLAIAITIVAITSLLIYSITGSHLAIGFDEGIYIAGAQRILSGQHLYRDFFEITGPGTFWLFALCFKLFPPTLNAAHALLSIEAALIASSLFLVTARQVNQLAAIAAAVASLALTVAFAHRLYLNHRWDSVTCLALSAALLSYAAGRPKLVALAGLFAGAAIVFTPPTLLAGLALAACLWLNANTRRHTILFAAAILVPLGLTASVLAAQGSLFPFGQNLLWVSQHYGRANQVPYGFVPAEPNLPADLFPFRHALIYLPSVLPLLSLLLAAILIWKKKLTGPVLQIVLAAGLALAASCYPRWANNNLLFASPLLIAFLFMAAAQLMDSKAFRIFSIASACVVALVTIFSLDATTRYLPQTTQLGDIECRVRDVPNVAFATAVVHPGESLFVYPYQPIWYSLTGGINPTAYDFLQPGMMTLGDEAKVLQQLEANPPNWVIWHHLSPRTVLSVWPNSDSATLHFHRVEAFIRGHYAQVRPPDSTQKYAIAIFGRKMP